MARSVHYLFRITQLPRALAYVLMALLLTAACLDAALPPWQWLLAAGLVIYPLLIRLGFAALCRRASGIRAVMAVDALLVGTLAWLLLASPAAAAALMMMLTTATLIVLRPAWALPVVFLAFAALGGLAALAPHPKPVLAVAFLDAAALLALGLFWSFVGYLMFREAASHRLELKAGGERESRLDELQRHLASFLAPEVVSASGIERKYLTVFFSDIQGFASLMEGLEEGAAAQAINEYFDAMTRIAQSNGGTLDKFFGDGMMVFFGDPESQGRAADALACLSMAAAMQQAVKQLSTRLGLPLAVRMGVHSGYCLVGSFGTRRRRDYTAFGTVVNIASRLEGLAPSGEILMSAETNALVEGAILAKPAGTHQLKGIANPVTAYLYGGVQV